jgi:site-specific DNA-methyltransferase (adenine-specific)
MQKNIIYNCDIMEGFQQLPDDSIDLCVTSPPYNCGIEYDSWNDSRSWPEYLDWCRNWLIEMKRVLKPDGRFAINHLVEMGLPALGKKNGVRVSPQIELYNIMQDIGLTVTAQPMWTDLTRSTLTSWGSWMSASAPYIYNPFEVILIGYKTQWKKNRNKDNKGVNTITKEDFMKGVGGIWNITPETRGLTKANFPVALPKLCIELLTFKDEIVLDPFMGSGTTAIACKQTGRNYIGFEISTAYCQVAQDRIDYYDRTGNITIKASDKKPKKTSIPSENPIFFELFPNYKTESLDRSD